MTVFHYIQATGAFYEVVATGDRPIAVGYSGAKPHVNDPSADGIVRQGPIPDGVYIALRARDHQLLGPVAIPLDPSHSTAKRGRSGFYIHGDNKAANRSASTGCIVLPRHARERVAAGDFIVVSTGV